MESPLLSPVIRLKGSNTKSESDTDEASLGSKSSNKQGPFQQNTRMACVKMAIVPQVEGIF